jgi:hypothetical protein
MPAEKEVFKVSYDGPALATHEMEVRDLAPALLGLADALHEANKIINGSGSKLSVKLKAGVSEGSVEAQIACELTNPNWFDAAQAYLLSDQAKALNVLLGLLGIGGVVGGATKGKQGVLWLVQVLKNRFAKIENTKDGVTTLKLPDGTTLQTDSRVVVLVNNPIVRKGLAEAVAIPLSKEGIDKLTIQRGEAKPEVITRKEAISFSMPEATGEVVTENIVEMYLEIVSVSFQEGYKWRLSDKTSTFGAAILDEVFLARTTNSQESFRGGDYLKVKMRLRQRQGPMMEPRTEHEVLEVLEHIQSPQQMKLLGKDESEQD